MCLLCEPYDPRVDPHDPAFDPSHDPHGAPMTATITDLFTRADRLTASTLADGSTEWLDGHGNITTGPERAARKAALAEVDDYITTRDGAILAIRKALRERTGRAWSVKGGRGTSWGWITVTAPPKRLGPFGEMSDDDRTTLAEALNLDAPERYTVSIPSQSDYRAEYVARARGEKPTVHGVPQWD